MVTLTGKSLHLNTINLIVMINIQSKLPGGSTTIFTVMSSLARQYQAINLSQGFPDYDCPEGLRAMVHKYLDLGKNQYAPMSGLPELRESIARKVNRSYSCNVTSDQITITAGATQALYTCIMAVVGEGDEVIIFEPAYDSYLPSIKLAGGVPVPYRMKAPDFAIDWSRVEEMITSRTKMIIINNPHNPTGTILNNQDLQSLEDITRNTQIVVLSDEVYEHLIYDGRDHQSVLLFPELMERSVAVYSFGKTFHSTGWKIGYCIGPEYLVAEFRKVHQWNVFCVNSFLQYALADYLADEDHYNYLPDFYQKKRDFLQGSLAESRLESLPSYGTYFQLYDYSAITELDDMTFAKKMTREYGVACIPVSVFYSHPVQAGLIRLCFAKKENTIKLAEERLKSI